MRKLLLLITILILNVQASIKDECFYMKPNEMGAKCIAGQEGESDGHTVVSILREKYGSNKWISFVYSPQVESEFKQYCKRATYPSKVPSKYKYYHTERCMEGLYEARRSIREIQSR